MTRTPDIGSNMILFCSGFALTSIGYVGLLTFGLPGKGLRWWGWLILLVIGSRLLALNLLPSDDIPRYIWEGRLIREGISPYSIPPDDPRLEYLRDDIVYPMMNHKDMPAIYPPFTHYIFALLTFITNSINGFRLFIVLIELCAIAVMMRWLRSEGLSVGRIVIYALNPLVIIGIAGHGHLDSIQILLLVSGLYAWNTDRKAASFVLITLCGLVKFLGLFALPFLINRKTIKCIPIPVLLIVVSYLPFMFMEGGLSPGNLNVYIGQFEYYSLTFAPLRWVFGTIGANLITVSVLLFSLIWLWLTRTRPIAAIFPLLTLVTLMSTTVHYWYLTPLLALAVVRRNRALIGLSLLFLPYFLIFKGLVETCVWVGEWWWQIVTYTGFIVLFVIELTGRWPAFSSRLPSLGVVVPVLNDGKHLKSLLTSLDKTEIKPDCVIIADGGSTDDTIEVAENWGAKVVRCSRKGRGNQITEGISELQTELILVLHADNIVPSNLHKIRRVALAYPDSAGGACCLRYIGGGKGLSLLSVISTLRVGILGMSFGDQGQWFRKDRVTIAAISLMEDVELAIQLNDKSGSTWTPLTLSVSKRRYEQLGRRYVTLTTFKRLFKYLIARRWQDKIPDTEQLYEEYYSAKR